MEKEQELVNSLQNMVVVVDENNDNSSDDGNLPQLLLREKYHLREIFIVSKVAGRFNMEMQPSVLI